MINYAKEKYDKMQSECDKLKQSTLISAVPIEQWEKRFVMLKGTKDFWDGLTWDQIGEMKLTGLEWVNPARNDPAFKEFVKIKMEMEKLRPLIK